MVAAKNYDRGLAFAHAHVHENAVDDYKQWVADGAQLKSRNPLAARTPESIQRSKDFAALKVEGSPVWPIDGGVASALVHSWVWLSITGFGYEGKGDEWGFGAGGATFEGPLWINANDTLDNFCQKTAKFSFDWVDAEGGAIAIFFSDSHGTLIGGATLASEGLGIAVGMAGKFKWKKH